MRHDPRASRKCATHSGPEYWCDCILWDGSYRWHQIESLGPIHDWAMVDEQLAQYAQYAKANGWRQ